MTDNVCWVPEGALEHLKEAERSLEAAQAREQTAEEALREAKQDTAKAEAKVKEAIHEVEHPREFPVEVVYDGVKKPFHVRREEPKRLLAQAIQAFGPLTNPHMLSLYKDGKELPDNSTIEQAGIKPCDRLLLRPSAVKGGW
jgi:NADH:ubiquinone oxidoreductase subunit D